MRPYTGLLAITEKPCSDNNIIMVAIQYMSVMQDTIYSKIGITKWCLHYILMLV